MASITLGKILDFDSVASKQKSDVAECIRCGHRGAFVCGAIQGGDFESFASSKTDLTLKPGAALYSAGDRAARVYNLTEGVLKLSQTFEDGRNQIIAFAFPGDFLGFEREDTWDHSAECLTRAKLCTFDRELFETFLQNKPEFKAAFTDMLFREVSNTRAQLLRLGRKTAVERVASFLMVLSGKAALLGATPERFSLPMSREDISDFLCLSTETVSRALSQLRQRDLIKTGKGRTVEISNVKALGTVARCWPTPRF